MTAPATVDRNDDGCRRFLRSYYLYSFWYECIFAYAIYTVYFSLHGMSVFQISLLLAWWTLTTMVFEVPTGALADRWSRPKLLIISPLVKALCFVTWYFAGHSFALFALGFTLWSLGGAFASGTTQAILYDTLVHHGRGEEYEQALGRERFYTYIALAVGMLSGGVIAAHRPEWTMLLSVFPLVLSALSARRLEEVPRADAARDLHYLEHIRLALREVRSSRVLLVLFIYLMGVSIFGDLEEFDQLYYRLAGLPIAAFGAVSFAWALLRGLASRWAYRLRGRASVLSLLPFVSAALLVGVWRRPSLPMIAILLAAHAVSAPAWVLAESRIQHGIRGMSRATVTSALELLACGLGVGIAVALGLISRAWGLPAIYLAGALVLLAASAWSLAWQKEMRVESRGADDEEAV